MRKRMAFALSEFFVVSLSPIDGFYPPYVIAAYWDVLRANALRQFPHAARADHAQRRHGLLPQHQGQPQGRRQRPPARRELRARGHAALHHRAVRAQCRRHARGSTPTTSPIETYGQSDITNLARVFTGYDWDYLSNGGTFTNVAWHDYDVPNTRFATNPMWFRANNHSTLAVSFLGTNIPANTPGPEALRIALDQLFNHANTGPFFARQMIQRLVTSNPSPGVRRPRRRGVRQQRRRRARRPESGVDRDPHRYRGAHAARAQRTRCPASCASRSCASCSGHAPWASRPRNGAYEIYDLSGSDNCARPEPAAFAVGVQFLPPRLRAAEHRHRHRRQSRRPNSSCSTKRRPRAIINFMQGVTRNGIHRREADLRRAAADRARRAGGDRVAQPAAHGESAVAETLTMIADRARCVQHHRGEHRRRQAQHAGHAPVSSSWPRPNTWCRNEAPTRRTFGWTRRVVLQRALQLGAMGVATPLAINLAAIGEAAAFDSTDYKALVCIFMYGGNDYANTVVPYDAANYALYHAASAAARRSEAGGIAHRACAARADCAHAGGRQALTDNLQYALAPQLAGLKSLFDQGRLAVQLNVGPADPADDARAVSEHQSRPESAAAEAVLAQRPAIGVAVEWHRRLDRGLGRPARRHRACRATAPTRCSRAFPLRATRCSSPAATRCNTRSAQEARSASTRSTAPLRDALNQHHHARQRARRSRTNMPSSRAVRSTMEGIVNGALANVNPTTRSAPAIRSPASSRSWRA